MAHEGSVHNSERRAVEAAEIDGVRLGIRLSAVFLDRLGHSAQAAMLREARIVESDGLAAIKTEAARIGNAEERK